MSSSTTPRECKWGLICYKLRDKTHSKDYYHEPAICKHGKRCVELDNPKHCYIFRHPDQARLVGRRKVDVQHVKCDWCTSFGAQYMLTLYSKYPLDDNYDNVCDLCLTNWENCWNNGNKLCLP